VKSDCHRLAASGSCIAVLLWGAPERGGEVCRRDLQCLLTSKVFDAIVCGGGGSDGGGDVFWREERRAGCLVEQGA